MATYGGLPTCPAGTAQGLSQTSLRPLHSHPEEDTTLIPFHRSKQTREVSAWLKATQPAGDGAKSLALCVGPSHPLHPAGLEFKS